MAYRLEAPVHETASRMGKEEGEAFVETWRKLLTSDHFYYMCTKYFADGDVHKYFSPYESPYDAHILYMNVMADMAKRVGLKEMAA
jgi:alpha-amylase